MSLLISFVRLFPALLLPLALTACGLTVRQKAAIKTFAESTGTLSDLASQEFAQDRADLIKMNEMRRSLDDPTVRTLDGNYTVDRVKTRVDSVTALKSYADLLNELATSSEAADIKSASDEFVVNLRKINGISFSDEQADAVSQAVQAVGGMIVEFKRKKAVKLIVARTHTPVIQLADLLSNSFDPKKDNWGLELDTAVTALRGQVVVARNKGLAANDLASEAVLQQGSSLADSTKQRLDTSSAGILDGCANLKHAEQNLSNLMEYDKFSTEDILTYAQSISDYVQLVKIISKR